MSDEEIIEAMNADDERKEELLRDGLDELHERKMRNDFEYFLENSNYLELKEAYDKLNAKMWNYGWVDNLKDFL